MEEVIGAENLENFVGGKIAVGETLNKIGAQFAVTFASNFPGNLNQSEVDLIKEAGLQLTTTPEGIDIMEKIFRQASERSAKELEIVESQFKDPKFKNMKPEDRYIAITSAIDKMRKETPLVTPEMISSLQNAKAQTETGYFFAKKDTGEDVGMTLTPNQVARAQIIFNPNIKDEDDFIANYGDEFQQLLAKQEKNKRFSTDDLRKFYKTYKQYNFKQRN